MPNESESSRARPVLQRVYWILERYLLSIERSFEERTPHEKDRERDARMINALARTLEKLAKLERVLASERAAGGSENQDALRDALESRIAHILDAGGEEAISEESDER